MAHCCLTPCRPEKKRVSSLRLALLERRCSRTVSTVPFATQSVELPQWLGPDPDVKDALLPPPNLHAPTHPPTNSINFALFHCTSFHNRAAPKALKPSGCCCTIQLKIARQWGAPLAATAASATIAVAIAVVSPTAVRRWLCERGAHARVLVNQKRLSEHFRPPSCGILSTVVGIL